MSFSTDITSFVKKTKTNADKLLRKIAFDMFAGVLRLSPVLTGRFRGNWNISVNRISLKTLPQTKFTVDKAVPTGSPVDAAERAKALGAVGKAKFGDFIAITNNLPYAEFLEGGGSLKAPNGMMKVTFERVKAEFNKIVRTVENLQL